MKSEITPPKLFARFFHWFCNPDLYEELQGDLQENFYRELERNGQSSADKLFRKEVLKLFRPSVIRQFNWQDMLPDLTMFRSYLHLAFRNLHRNSAYAFGNIFGLTVGITACLLIFLYLWGEWHFDDHHQKSDQIYRLNSNLILPDQDLELALAAGPVGPALQNTFPQIKAYTQLSRPQTPKVIVKEGEKSFEDGAIYADATFFQFFDFPLLHGDRTQALIAPYSLVLSEHMAQKYFARKDVVGEEIQIDGQIYQITAVMQDIPDNSHLQSPFILSFSTWIAEKPHTNTNWNWTNFPTYLMLSESTDAKILEEQIASFYETNKDQSSASEMKVLLSLEPFQNLHFNPARLGELQAKGNKKYLGFLALSALFILIMAILNFVNLSTVKGTNRSKEIGVRKTIGALC